jgi:predicted ferric reductase
VRTVKGLGGESPLHQQIVSGSSASMVNWGVVQAMTFFPFLTAGGVLFVLGEIWPVCWAIDGWVIWGAIGTLIVEGVLLRSRYEWWWIFGLAIPLMLLLGGLGLGL